MHRPTKRQRRGLSLVSSFFASLRFNRLNCSAHHDPNKGLSAKPD